MVSSRPACQTGFLLKEDFSVRGILKLISGFICPEKCVSCGEILDIKSDKPFCPRCAEKWEREKLRERDECLGQPVAGFADKPTERSGYVCYLVRYDPHENTSAAFSLIWRLKSFATASVIDFAADELAGLITSAASAALVGRDPEDIIVTNIPRRPKNVLNTGYDHMAECARAAASKLGFRYAPLLARTSAAREQKSLGRSERVRNAEETMFLKRKYRNKVADKIIILMDDIVTSGASLGAAASILLEAGAKMIISATLAATKTAPLHEKARRSRGERL